MAWYEQTSFYHIYPLGLTGAPEINPYGEPEHRLRQLFPWIEHVRELGLQGIYIGPLFESGSHGYDTTDLRRVDSRLGTNDDLREFVERCHKNRIRVILDGVFNHTGRDFFAFRDILQNREHSRYVNWYCNVDFRGDNAYHDGFRYDNWGGYDLLAKLNQSEPQVRDYLLDTVRFWVSEFDIDGIRLDAADVLDFAFMQDLRRLSEEVKEDLWLMGEVIHGDYTRWVNERTLHSVTNYHLHKALYSGHNDHNYFEIAHTVKRQMDMGLLNGIRLYSFVDNHDVERIYTRLNDKAHFLPVHVLLFTLPGVPSIYYGSEFGVDGRKEKGSDASLRPCLEITRPDDAASFVLSAKNGVPTGEEEQLRAQDRAQIVRALGRIYSRQPALWYGAYQELQLTTTKYAFLRGDLIITVNNDQAETEFDLPGTGSYTGALSGRKVSSEGGRLHLFLEGDSGEIWIPQERAGEYTDTVLKKRPDKTGPRTHADTQADKGMQRNKDPQVKMEKPADPKAVRSAEEGRRLPVRCTEPKPYEEMTIEELQAEILAKMAANGPVTDRMKQDVLDNVYPNSLLNWVRSFR